MGITISDNTNLKDGYLLTISENYRGNVNKSCIMMNPNTREVYPLYYNCTTGYLAFFSVSANGSYIICD